MTQPARAWRPSERFGIKMPANVPMTVTDRAYTSPVWYAPGR